MTLIKTIMEYRYRIAGRQWLARLLLITVTSAIAPLYVSAEETNNAGVASVAAVAAAAVPDSPEESAVPEVQADDMSGGDEPNDEDFEVAEELYPEENEQVNDVDAGEGDVHITESLSDAASEEVEEGNTFTGAEKEPTALSVAPPDGSTTTTSGLTPDEIVATTSVGTADEDEADDTSSNNNEHHETTTNHASGDETAREAETEAVTNQTTTPRSSDSSAEAGANENPSVVGASTSAGTEIFSNSTTTPAIDSASDEAATSAAAVTIASGKAVALANVINIVNTNFVNSEGVVFFSNFLDAVNESIDFRWLYEALAGFGCSLSKCNATDTTVNSSDTTSIDNYMYLEAISGQNTISGADSAVIKSGDAYAGLNLINVANMNFIDSNYLLVTLNAFSDVNGDIVFPSANAFLSTLGSGPSSASVQTANSANVHNNITVDANSGDNTLETSAGGSISTGASGATSNVFNQINSSFIGGQNVTILFRIHGDWVGEVFGAPQDLVWQEGPDGSVFVFDTGGGSGGGSGGNHSVLTHNSASINNDVQVVALTGENKITGAETGIISAGNAYAGANIVNLANGTVVGRNWILAIINIFGDFKGNIAFGRPDLWVGQMIEAPKNVREGSRLTYKFSVINNGDSTATDVTLTDTYDSKYLKITDTSVPYTRNENGEVTFKIGALGSGEATEISYNAEVIYVGNKSREITNVVSVTSREADNNMSDNTDTATVVASEKQSNSSATRVGLRKSQTAIEPSDTMPLMMAADASALQILRTSSATTLSAASPVIQQYITLINRGDMIIPSLQYVDILRGANGTSIDQQTWDLGNVLPGEEIGLGYTITFGDRAPRGEYTFTSVVSSGLYEQVYLNGRIVFLGGQMPALDNSQSGEQQVRGASQLADGISFTEVTTSRQAATSSKQPLDLEFPFLEDDIFVPPLATHSVSTTQQQNHNHTTLSMWFSQLFAYISSLLSKFALAMNT